jgi:hypothetical protein
MNAEEAGDAEFFNTEITEVTEKTASVGSVLPVAPVLNL